MEWDEPTAEELQEAQALADALEGKVARAPQEALEAAALLRCSARGALAEDRREALGRRVMASVPDNRVPWWRVRWLVPAGGLAVMALILILRPPGQAARLPAPTMALIQAQARAAGSGQGLVELEGQMGRYRASVLAALGEEP